MGAVGAPTKFTEEYRQKILTNLRSGCSIRVACQAAGVSESLFYEWQAAGREAAERREKGETLTDHQQTLVEFLEGIHSTYTAVEVQSLAQIRAAGQKEWRAAAWIVERRNPQEWGPPTARTELTGAGGGPIQVEQVLDRALAFIDVDAVSPNGDRPELTGGHHAEAE